MVMRFALIAVLVTSAMAQQTPQAAQGEASKPGSIEGRVVNAKTGEPVRRANLTLRPFGSPGGMGGGGSIAIGSIVPIGPMSQSAPYAATTDAEGKFRIDKVEPGQYRIMAERQGFVRAEYGARMNSMMGTTIRVSPGQELREMNINLAPQAVITGRVFDEEGEPLARVQIQVLRRRYFRGKQQLMPSGMSQTNDTGEFRVAELPPGRYWLSASYRTRMMMMFGEAPARNTADKPEEEYVTTYFPGTAEQSSARPIDVTAGQEVPGADIRMHKARVFRIRGKVVGGAQGPRNIQVMALPRESSGFFMFGGGRGLVKEDGSFEIGGVQSGSYYVTAMSSQGPSSTLGKTPVEVTRDNVENVAIVLGGGVALNGGIRVDGDVEALEKAQGKKINYSTVRVQLSPMEGMPFNTPGVQAKEDGSFTIENVGPDKYRIMVFNAPQGTWLKSIRAGDQEVLDKGMDLSAGAPGPIQVTLGLGTGGVSGSVEDSNQKPASGSMVTLLPDPMKEDRNDLYRVTTTDQTGQFTMSGIPPGEYKVFAWEDVDPGSYMDPELLKQHESKAAKVTVKENSQQSVSLAQIPAVTQ